MSATTGAAARGIRFAIVATIGMAVQLAVLVLLVRAAGVDLAPATAAAVALTVVHNYAWHEQWTWRDRAGVTGRQRMLRFVRYLAVTGSLSVLGSVAVTVVLARHLRVPLPIANVVAVGVLGAANFAAAHRLVFLPRRAPARRAAPLTAPRAAPRSAARGFSGCRG